MKLARVAALASSLIALPADAQYTLPRGNPSRTGRVSTAVPTAQAPSKLWRSFMGGSLGYGSPMYVDAAADGTTDLLVLAGGVLAAKRPNDALTWQATAVELRSLVDIVDLDGDETAEIVATAGGGRLVVVSPLDGEILFDAALVPATGSVWVRDLNGDGLDDLYVPTKGCGAGGSSEGVALSFAAGVDHPSELWQLEQVGRDYYCANYHVFADLEGDRMPEIVVPGMSHAYAFDAATGAFRFGSDDIGRTPYGLARCTPTDVQADGDEELVCLSDASYQPSLNARRVFALELDADSPSLELLWTVDVADLISDRNAFVDESVADLDGDGTPEVVHSFFEGATDAWTTFARDGATGAELAAWPGAEVRALVDLDGDGAIPEIVVWNTAGLVALRFNGDGFEQLWSLNGVDVTRVVDRSYLSSRGITGRPATIDTDLGPALLVQQETARGDVASLRAVLLSAVEPTEVARYDAPDGTVFKLIATLEASQDPDAVLVVATSEARLITLDSTLEPTNRVEDPEFPVLGARHGGLPALATGLPAFPLAADGDEDGAAEVVLGDSRGSLSLVDARNASMTVEPAEIWSAPDAGYAAFFDGPGAGLGTVVQTGTALRAFGPEGTPLWEIELLDAGPDARFMQDLLPFPAPEATDDIFVYRKLGGTSAVEGMAISGADGSSLWPQWVALGFPAEPPRPATWADLDSDGQVELVIGPGAGTLAAYDITDGSLVRSTDGVALNMPVVVDVDEDGIPELLQTANSILGAIDAAFEELWRVPGETGLANYGALVRCASPVWVTSRTSGPELRAYDLQTGSLITEAALAGGGRFDGVGDATAAGAVLGSLHGVTVAASAEDPSADVALVGSSDGYLYALDACDLGLLWALNLGADVSQAVPTDTAGNSRPVIVATVGDGYVYGLGIPEVEAPGTVLDTDPPNGVLDDDVDEIETLDTLFAKWSGPPGVEYEVSIVTSDLAPVTNGFQSVGADLQAAVGSLDLRLGVRYLFSVRARQGDLISPESVSDGVVVVDRTPPEVSITAEPPTLRHGTDEHTVLTVHASDTRELAWVAVEVRAPDGATAETILDSPASGPEIDWISNWDARTEAGQVLAPGRYEAVARAVDAAGNEATATALIEVIDEEEPDAGQEGEDAGEGTEEPRYFVRGGGCACRAASSPALSGCWPFVAALLLARICRRVAFGPARQPARSPNAREHP